MKHSYETNAFGAVILIFVGLAIVIGFLALIAWIVSVCVSSVFGIDFGFWQAVAAVILANILGSIVFGRVAKSNAE